MNSQERSVKLRIITHKLPASIHGLSAPDGDEFIVLINEAITPEEQREAFIHEMLHIWNKDHDREKADVQVIEAQCHAETARIASRQRTEKDL